MSEYTIRRTRRRTLALEVTRNGETVVHAPLRASEETIAAFVEKHCAWLARAQEKQRLRAERFPEPDEAQKRALIALAKQRLPEKVALYAAQMGVVPSGIRITDAQTRFGSCSAKNALCFSWRLMRYPEEAIDYVVVHELAHIRHHDHSPAFYAVVESVLPDHQERRRLLR